MTNSWNQVKCCTVNSWERQHFWRIQSPTLVVNIPWLFLEDHFGIAFALYKAANTDEGNYFQIPEYSDLGGSQRDHQVLLSNVHLGIDAISAMQSYTQGRYHPCSAGWQFPASLPSNHSPLRSVGSCQKARRGLQWSCHPRDGQWLSPASSVPRLSAW